MMMLIDMLLFDVMGAMRYNTIFIVLGLAGLIRAGNNKSYYGCIISGCIIQGFLLFGNYLGVSRSSSPVDRGRFIYDIIVFFILLALFWMWCYSIKHKAERRAALVSNAPVLSEEEKKELEEKKFVCNSCGHFSSGWYQICPNCGAAGKMVRSTVTAEAVIDKQEQKTADAIEQDAADLIESQTSLDGKDSSGYSLNLESLPAKLRRAFIFIEDEEWDRADEYLEIVLDEEPENAYAYLGKAFVDIKIESPEHITQAELTDLENNRYFQRAKKYASADLKNTIEFWERELQE